MIIEVIFLNLVSGKTVKNKGIQTMATASASQDAMTHSGYISDGTRRKTPNLRQAFAFSGRDAIIKR